MAETKKVEEFCKAPSWLWWALGGFSLAVIIFLGINFAPARPPAQARLGPQQMATPQQWQLCWEKKPEHVGKTGIRQLCLPALVETRTPARIVISYSCSSGQGVMEGTSIDGNEYDGQWKDSAGWGKWHLRFVSPDTAFGWSDDEGAGEKTPNVLAKRRERG